MVGGLSVPKLIKKPLGLPLANCQLKDGLRLTSVAPVAGIGLTRLTLSRVITLKSSIRVGLVE